MPRSPSGRATATPRSRPSATCSTTTTFYEELPAFEKEWQDYTEAPFVKNHINGTSALTSMYFALDLPPGSEIMVPSYTFFATCLAMRFFGCVPIFIDIDPKTATFDLEDAKRKLTPRTKAVVPMHSWGLPCQMDMHQRLGQREGAHRAGRRRPRARRVHAGQEDGHLGRDGHLQLPGLQGACPASKAAWACTRRASISSAPRLSAITTCPAKFPTDSPVHPYDGTGFGQKYRMHPLAAALARQQLKGLDAMNQLVEKNVRAHERSVDQAGRASPSRTAVPTRNGSITTATCC